MKRTFLAKRNALISGGPSIGAVALGIVVILVALRMLIPDAFWFLMAPALRAGASMSHFGDSLTAGFAESATLAQTNENLIQENQRLNIENTALKRELAALGASSARSGIVAGVLSRPPESPYDTFLVNAGSEQGVMVGMEAFAGSAAPVGVVSSVSSYFARVTLFSAPNMQVSGWMGSSSVPVLLYGEGGGALGTSVSRDTAAALGDTVYVPGPGHLPIGRIVRVDSDQSSPSVTLRIEPFINPFSIGWLELRDIGTGFLHASTTP